MSTLPLPEYCTVRIVRLHQQHRHITLQRCAHVIADVDGGDVATPAAFALTDAAS